MRNGAEDVTTLLGRVKRGDRAAEARLVPLVYGELHKIARAHMRQERPGHTLSPTALVNEAYLRLAGQSRTDWKSRLHFYGVAARIMRRILVQYARDRVAAKRGGHQVRVDLDRLTIFSFGTPKPEEILAIDEALSRLAVLDARQAKIAELRYFCDLSVEETAQALGISPRTVKSDWAVARLWLRAELAGTGGEGT